MGTSLDNINPLGDLELASTLQVSRVGLDERYVQHGSMTSCQIEISLYPVLPWALTSLTVIPAMAMFAGRKEGVNLFQAM